MCEVHNGIDMSQKSPKERLKLQPARDTTE